MKKLGTMFGLCLLAVGLHAAVIVEQLDLNGKISEQELSLQMTFDAEVQDAPQRMALLSGDALPTGISLPRGVDLIKEADAYFIEFSRNGSYDIAIDFEVKVVASGQRRSAVFTVPSATIRKMTLQTEEADYNVEIPGAPLVQKLDATRVQTFLPATGEVVIRWRPEVKKLAGELVASCDSILIGSAKVGALQLQGRYLYTIPQGRMKELTMNLPEALNIIQVSGADLLAWDIREQAGVRQLVVELSRPQEKSYELTLLAEKSLPEFPCSFDFPVIEPQDVLRANGVVLVGTDSTIKLLVDELGGVTQVEPDAVNWGELTRPKRGLYAYMFANMPFSMKLSADNIVTSLYAQDELILSLSEKDAALDAKIDLEVRDAPARDLEIEVSRDWTATGVTGRNVADYDVRDRDGSRWIKVYFKAAVDSRTLVQLRLEQTLPDGAQDFKMPVFRVADAKSERGFLVLRGETGTRLEGTELDGLREVNTGSLPIQMADARQAFRFKRADWSGRVRVFQEQASIHTESFQLVSLGESGAFGSSLITYNIANAPIRSLEIQVPAACRNVEFHGRDIRNWTQNGERWTLYLQQKVIGDYTLLVTYDQPADYQGEEMTVGGIQALNVESETGYIALAGAANLSLAEEVNRSPSTYLIDVDEVPEEYALLVNDPMMHVYKYGAAPHEATVRIKRFATQGLLTQVADHITLNTTLSKDGEAVTLAVYHVKNTDQQYLPIRLPEGATLWSVNVDGSKIQVLDEGDGQMLIPVERRRDPNAPIKIEVTYAEQLATPGFFARLRFQSPKVDTQSVFSRWTFQLPDGERLLSAKGNMELPSGLAGRQVAWGKLLSRFSGGHGFFWLIMSSALAGALYLLGRGNGMGASRSALHALTVMGALVFLCIVGFMLLEAAVVLAGSAGHSPAEWAFSKSVSGSDDGLSVRLTLASAQFGIIKNGALLLAGLVPLIWMAVSGRRKMLIPALILLMVLFSFSPYLAWFTVWVPHVWVGIVCYRLGRRNGVERAELLRSQRANLFDRPASATGKEGFARPQLLGGIFAVVLTVIGCASVLPDSDPVLLKAERVVLKVSVPEFETESKVNVMVQMDVELSAEKAGTLRLLGPEFILTGLEVSSRHLQVTADSEGSLLTVDRAGSYTVSLQTIVPAEYTAGEWVTKLWIPDALENRAEVQFPITGWTLKSDEAIRVRQNDTLAEVLFAPESRNCMLRWTPEERQTDLETARFFCDINTLAEFRPGMVRLQHQVELSIAQGELQRLQFDVPGGMSVTEVHGEHIGTWRYDPETGVLDVVLAEPASKTCELTVGAQVVRKKLPYEAPVQGLRVRNAVMQRGIVAVASTDAVQVDVLAVSGLSPINTADAAHLLVDDAEVSIKRAFRYNLMPFSATVSADQVLPELRLVEETTLDLATEQSRLVSRLNVTVSKAGIFALRIAIPEGFDVDSLSGDAISHWDEVGTVQKEVVVNFQRQITGTVLLNLGLSRSGRDLAAEFSVPRIQLEGVLKHTGSLVVTAERGIRVTPMARDGVSEISPRELGIRQEGCLAYRLLRPDWSIVLQSEVMAPKLNVEVLQRVELSEGPLKVRNYLQYEIEHAGVKTFRLKSPNPAIALVVSGRNISRVRKVDDAQGIWEVELHGKVDTRYGMEVAYKVPVALDQADLTLQPLQTLGTDSQKGYVAVLSSGRLQVTPSDVPDFMRTEDARSIPRIFGAGDLSAAVLCYRATERDYELTLHVVRHSAADVLPAQVQSVRIDSVVTQEDHSLNNLTMTLEPGSLRFLEMTLPEASEIWSVFVNETAVRPLVENGRYLIPIEPGADLSAVVEVMYAQNGSKSLLGSKHSFSGPQFKLPLTDVRWTFYAPEAYRYSRFAGTLEYQKPPSGWLVSKGRFSEREYYDTNSSASQRFGASAKENILEGNMLMQSGDQRNARKAFQKAISYSQGQQALNEDARVQFRNLVRQQGVVGLVNRRNQLKQTLNQVDEQAQISVGNDRWSGADVEKIQAQLGEKESSSLSALAEKMLDQQQAATVEVHPIRVLMAKQGVELVFERSLQLQSDAEMQVEFHSAKEAGNHAAHLVIVATAAGIILLLGRFSAGLKRKVRR